MKNNLNINPIIKEHNIVHSIEPRRPEEFHTQFLTIVETDFSSAKLEETARQWNCELRDLNIFVYRNITSCDCSENKSCYCKGVRSDGKIYFRISYKKPNMNYENQLKEYKLAQAMFNATPTEEVLLLIADKIKEINDK